VTQPFDYDAELRRYHQRLLTAAEVGADEHVLDIGCGTGLSTREAAEAAVFGSALGIDISEQSLATARRLSEEQGLRNVSFEEGDAQVHPFPAQRFSLGISRFGTMFFADPEAAFTNIARALRPGARLVQLVWQDQTQQEWVAVIRDALGGGRSAPPPGAAFSLADPDVAERLLVGTGFGDVQIVDVREPVYYGPDPDAVCEAIRNLHMARDLLEGLDPDQTDQAFRRLLDVLAARQTADGIWFDSRAWIITAERQ
jgi:SAM-dependent methyltransferase